MHPTALLTLLSLLLPGTSAHTWIEQLRLINPNGTFTPSLGYPRGMVPRSSPLFSDAVLTHLLPPNGRSPHKILSTDPMCMLSQSVPGLNTPGLPRLPAGKGDHVALRYQENGHVTIPETNPGKPKNRGTVYIYGTEKPLVTDKFMDIHKVWTADGKGGDGRGVLLATRNYDDGQCYQANSHPISLQRQKQFPKEANAEMGVNLWCQSDVKLPAEIGSKQYTLYWVWDWPTAAINGAEAMPEVYTTCMDVDISSSTGASAKLTSEKGSVQFVEGQDINNAGIKGEMEEQFIVPVDGSTGGSSSGESNAKSAAATPIKSSATPPVGGATVTVTAPGTMITVTVTANAPANTQTRPSSVQQQQSSVSPTRPIVTPFLTTTPTPTSASGARMGTVTEVVEETVTETQTMVMQMGGVYTARPESETASAVPRIRGRAPRGF
ncbi:hypothetical protein VC83_06529 [Pseudogymnoascus destructans]|uniref:DUF7492 domain-containing protein n=2 Tax=Pseudogymnoascus destructans TaxID=655981 RepID=L8FZP0_PSED2|nr:uncharacterized protein VC83_06529 [Pseudogymnoascus destructans]ELR05181.1 hypothetical protein GMDG_07222 [Pseudogymnoascus destructans 20631-21]OAF58201.1 hypothetical protein VC83_06529 [Pseudogymnoascus destructans]